MHIKSEAATEQPEFHNFTACEGSLVVARITCPPRVRRAPRSAFPLPTVPPTHFISKLHTPQTHRFQTFTFRRKPVQLFTTFYLPNPGTYVTQSSTSSLRLRIYFSSFLIYACSLFSRISWVGYVFAVRSQKYLKTLLLLAKRRYVV